MASQPAQNDDEWEYEYDYNDTEVSYGPKFDGAFTWFGVPYGFLVRAFSLLGRSSSWIST